MNCFCHVYAVNVRADYDELLIRQFFIAFFCSCYASFMDKRCIRTIDRMTE